MFACVCAHECVRACVCLFMCRGHAAVRQRNTGNNSKTVRKGVSHVELQSSLVLVPIDIIGYSMDSVLKGQIIMYLSVCLVVQMTIPRNMINYRFTLKATIE